METITSSKDLKKAILALEEKKIVQEKELKEAVHQKVEDLKPVNLIKKGIHQFTHQDNFIGKILNTSVALTTGYFSKKLIFGQSPGLIRKMAGGLLQLGATKLIGNNLSKFKGKIAGILRKRRAHQ